MYKLVILFFIISKSIYSFDFEKDYIDKLSWKTFSANLTLRIKKNNKRLSTREMIILARQKDNSQDILAIFEAPSNFKGMAFLAKCENNLEDERFVYIRSLRRVKKVPASGEDYTLRNFLSLYLLKPRKELWNFKQIKESDKFFIIEARAKNSSVIKLTGYEKILHFIDKKTNLIAKTQFYGKNNKLRLEQIVLENKKINETNVIIKTRALNKEENLDSEIILKNVKINENISNMMFTSRYLRSL